jgi:hypothetical protein
MAPVMCNDLRLVRVPSEGLTVRLEVQGRCIDALLSNISVNMANSEKIRKLYLERRHVIDYGDYHYAYLGSKQAIVVFRIFFASLKYFLRESRA